MARARPYKVHETTEHKDKNIVQTDDRINGTAFILEASTTAANILAYSSAAGTDDQNLMQFLIGSIIEVEQGAKSMLAKGVGNLASRAKELTNFNTHWESVFAGGRAADEDAIDCDKTAVSLDLGVIQLQKRLAHIQSISCDIRAIFPNRLWDATGDAYLIDIISVADLLEMLGTYVGGFAQTAVAGIIYEGQFGHRLSNFKIGADAPLNEVFDFLQSNGAVSGATDFVAVPSALKTSGLPTSSQDIRSALEHNFKLSKLGLNFGRNCFGFGVRDTKVGKQYGFNFLTCGSDAFDTNEFDFSVPLAVAIYLLSIYTDAVNALGALINKHTHVSWNGVKEYFDSKFTDVGLKSFNGFCEPEILLVNQLMTTHADKTVGGAWYTNVTLPYDGSATHLGLLANCLWKTDDNSHLHIDRVKRKELAYLMLYWNLFAMEVTSKVIDVYSYGGILTCLEGKEEEYVAIEWDPDATDNIDELLQGILPGSTATLLDIQNSATITETQAVINASDRHSGANEYSFMHFFMTYGGSLHIEYFYSDHVQYEWWNEVKNTFRSSMTPAPVEEDPVPDKETEEEV